jgi:hypothetical protein
MICVTCEAPPPNLNRYYLDTMHFESWSWKDSLESHPRFFLVAVRRKIPNLQFSMVAFSQRTDYFVHFLLRSRTLSSRVPTRNTCCLIIILIEPKPLVNHPFNRRNHFCTEKLTMPYQQVQVSYEHTRTSDVNEATDRQQCCRRRSLPIPIKIPTHQEPDESFDVSHYDVATWNMYNLIMTHRHRRNQEIIEQKQCRHRTSLAT